MEISALVVFQDRSNNRRGHNMLLQQSHGMNNERFITSSSTCSSEFTTSVLRSDRQYCSCSCTRDFTRLPTAIASFMVDFGCRMLLTPEKCPPPSVNIYLDIAAVRG